MTFAGLMSRSVILGALGGCALSAGAASADGGELDAATGAAGPALIASVPAAVDIAPSGPAGVADLCGTPRDAPTCTACGIDGLGYILGGHCLYRCRLEDGGCSAPVPADPSCAPPCIAPFYVPLQACGGCDGP